MFNRYTVMIGLNDKDSRQPVKSYDEAKIEISGRLAQLEISATITRGTGVYKHEDGTVIIEDTVVISIIDFDGRWDGVAQAFYDRVKRDYNQESIAVMVDKIESKLV